MPFYVPLGPRGLLMHVGTILLGLWGSLIYELARRRRVIAPSHPHLPVLLSEITATD